MTEPRGRAARWHTALLLVPGAAVTFGAAVAWAAGGTPTVSSVPSASPPTASYHADRAARAHAAEVAAYRHRLELQIREHRRHSHDLRRELATLRTRAGRLGQPTSGTGPVVPVPVVAAPHAGVVVVPPPPPPVVAPAPPVHATTGASGHP